jgi:hypothetical protein
MSIATAASLEKSPPHKKTGWERIPAGYEKTK